MRAEGPAHAATCHPPIACPAVAPSARHLCRDQPKKDSQAPSGAKYRRPDEGLTRIERAIFAFLLSQHGKQKAGPESKDQAQKLAGFQLLMLSFVRLLLVAAVY